MSKPGGEKGNGTYAIQLKYKFKSVTSFCRLLFVFCLVRPSITPKLHPLWTQHSQTGWDLQCSSAQLKQHQLIQINKTQVSNKPAEAVLLKWNFHFIINPSAGQQKTKLNMQPTQRTRTEELNFIYQGQYWAKYVFKEMDFKNLINI